MEHAVRTTIRAPIRVVIVMVVVNAPAIAGEQDGRVCAANKVPSIKVGHTDSEENLFIAGEGGSAALAVCIGHGEKTGVRHTVSWGRKDGQHTVRGGRKGPMVVQTHWAVIRQHVRCIAILATDPSISHLAVHKRRVQRNIVTVVLLVKWFEIPTRVA